MEYTREFCGLCFLFFLLVIVVVNKYWYSESDAPNYIKQSKIPEAGNGVFASKFYKKGDVIEECHCLYDHAKYLSKTIIVDYSWDENLNGNHIKYFPVTGNCNFVNHSDNHNADTKIDIPNKKMQFVALRDIQKGEEIYINYGPGYWMNRKKNNI